MSERKHGREGATGMTEATGATGAATPRDATGRAQRPAHDDGPIAAPFSPSALRYDARGLIPAVAQDAASGSVLMVAWMNEAAVAETLASGRVTYWSRSRRALWRKGETSGHVQRLLEMRLDCDADTLLLLVEQTGPACHTNRATCFSWAVRDGEVCEIAAPEDP